MPPTGIKDVDWNLDRETIFRWLCDRAATFASPYQAAIRLLADKSFPSQVNLICHLFRDIIASLPKEFAGSSKTRGADIASELMSTIANSWRQAFPRNVAKVGELIVLPDKAPSLDVIENQIRRWEDQVTTDNSYGLRFVNALVKDSSTREPPRQLIEWSKKQFDDDYNYFVSRAHLGSGTTTDSVELAERIGRFEKSFATLVRTYFASQEVLKHLMASTASDDVDKLTCILRASGGRAARPRR